MKDYQKSLLIIGVLGALWFKVIEWYVQIRIENVSLTLGSVIFSIIGLVFISYGISYLIYKWSSNLFYVSLVPMIWFLVKDLLNVLFWNMEFNAWLTATLPESILIGLPIGLGLYTLRKQRWA